MLNSDETGVNTALIRKQLSEILSSHEFRNSTVVSRFLEFVVEEVLGGRANEIKEYTIGVKALGRSVDFNPQFDAVVRIHAGRLRRMLREYYNFNSKNQPLIIDIPKGSYVPVFKLADNESVAGIETPTLNGSDIHHNGKLYRKATVAVFPFHNLSADDSRNYFAEGIGEQLSVELARFEHLSVISYYSTYKIAAEKDGREIRKMFDIDYAIMGSTRFFDGQVQINLQVMLAETDTVLWSHSFIKQFNPDHVLKLQEDVIQQVLYKVADQNGIITKNIANKAIAKNKDAFGVYDAVYLYFSFRGQYDPESFEQARLAVERAATLDPQNALIWAMLSRLHLNSYIFSGVKYPEELEKGKAFAEKAFWLDPDCQYAYKALAWAHLLTRRSEDCGIAIEKCLEINANSPSMLGSVGFLSICIGRYTQGFTLLSKASTLNPIHPWYCNAGFALYYFYAGDYKQAWEWAQKIQPADMPFISLVRRATAHKQKVKWIDPTGQAVSAPTEVIAASDILSMFIHDKDLKERLLNELQSSGASIR